MTIRPNSILDIAKNRLNATPENPLTIPWNVQVVLLSGEHLNIKNVADPLELFDEKATGHYYDQDDGSRIIVRSDQVAAAHAVPAGGDV